MLTDQAQLEEAFEKVPVIDMETKMVMIVLFGTFEKGEYLQNIKIENGILEVIMAYKAGGVYPEPIFCCYAWQLDKIEINNTKIIFVEQ